MKNYEVEKIPFPKISYHQDWMEKGANIYAAKSSKKELQTPSVFVVYPQIEYKLFESLAALKRIPEKYAFFRDFYKHPNGAEKVTNIIISSTTKELTSKTMKSVNEIKNLTVKYDSAYLMELYFDNNRQGKSFDLRPEVPLKIYL